MSGQHGQVTARACRDEAKRHSNLFRVSFLAVTLWFAFGLRLIYIRQVSPFVDEYISMLAMQSIVERGSPVLPSGLFYGPIALLHSYAGALVFWLLGPSEFAVRFLSVLTGVTTVCCVYRAGRDWFSPSVGESAAVVLAWLPSAVEWSGRARMYGLLQLLALAGGYWLINGYLKTHHRCTRVLGILTMLLAVFSHTLALIVLGGLVVGVVAAWLISPSDSPSESKAILRPSFWEVLAGAILVVAVFLLNPMGRPWGAQASLSNMAQGSLSPSDILERLRYLLAFTHQFVTWPLWPLTVLCAIGFIRLISRLIKKSSIPGDRVALCLYVLLLCAWFATSILSALHDDRYLFGIIPFYLLLAFRELYLFVEVALKSAQLTRLRANAVGVSGVIALLIILPLAPSTIRLMGNDPYGFGPAFLYVRDSWQPGDVVATCSPAPSHLILGHADYYVIQYGAESQNGADVWTGAPLIDTPVAFAAILDRHSRVWFAIEKLCWERHFDADFYQAVQDNMQVVFDQKGMLVFVSNPH